jgi:hypothetical protein
VFSARSFGPSMSSIAPGAAVTADFQVPPSGSIETGASNLVVIVNGLPSASVAVTVGTTSRSANFGPGTVTSSPADQLPQHLRRHFWPWDDRELEPDPRQRLKFSRMGWRLHGQWRLQRTMNANQNVMATFWTDGSSSPAAARPPGVSSVAPGPVPSLSALR